MSGRKVAVLALLVLAGAGGAWWWINRPSPPLQWQGYAEADFVKVGPTQQGLLMTLAVRRGDQGRGRRAAVRAGRHRRPRRARSGGAPASAGRGAARQSPGERQADRDPAGRSQSRRRPGRPRQDPGRPQAQRAAGEDQRRLPADRRPAARRPALRDAKVQGVEAALAQMRAPMGREREIKAQQAAVEAARAARRHDAVAARPAPRRWRRSPASSPTSSRGRARRSPPARRWCRCCRRRTFSCASSCPNRGSPRSIIGDQVRLVCDSCPADLAADHLLHLAAGRIHAAGDLQRDRSAPSSSTWSRRGPPRSRPP